MFGRILIWKYLIVGVALLLSACGLVPATQIPVAAPTVQAWRHGD